VPTRKFLPVRALVCPVAFFGLLILGVSGAVPAHAVDPIPVPTRTSDFN